MQTVSDEIMRIVEPVERERDRLTKVVKTASDAGGELARVVYEFTEDPEGVGTDRLREAYRTFCYRRQAWSAVERQFKLARAYVDMRLVLEATWPPRSRPFKRLRHREAIRRLVVIARGAGVNPDGWRGVPDA